LDQASLTLQHQTGNTNKKIIKQNTGVFAVYQKRASIFHTKISVEGFYLNELWSVYNTYTYEYALHTIWYIQDSSHISELIYLPSPNLHLYQLVWQAFLFHWKFQPARSRKC